MELSNIPDLTDEELDSWQSAFVAEMHRRQVMKDAQRRATELEEKVEQEMEEIAVEFLHARDFRPGVNDDPPWIQPTGAHNAYPKNRRVKHNNKIWRSIVSGNDHEPGTDHGQAWVEEVPEPPANQHTAWGSGQAVKVNDLRTHNGRLWRSKLDHTTHAGWEPSVHAHAVWEDVGVAPARAGK